MFVFQEGAYVAQYKFTVLLMPNGPHKITGAQTVPLGSIFWGTNIRERKPRYHILEGERDVIFLGDGNKIPSQAYLLMKPSTSQSTPLRMQRFWYEAD